MGGMVEEEDELHAQQRGPHLQRQHSQPQGEGDAAVPRAGPQGEGPGVVPTRGRG